MREGAEAVNVILASGGTMGALMRVSDRMAQALGAPETWSPGFCSVLSVCLSARYPVGIYWGPDFLLLYNDGWLPILGKRHPWALCRPAREVWPEIWADLEPRFQQVLQNGETLFGRNELFFLERHGYLEECYFEYAISPIRDDQGRIAGLFNPSQETTHRVLNERGRRVLHQLAEDTSSSRTVVEACGTAARSLTSGSSDAAFCMIYRVQNDPFTAVFCGAAGFDPEGPACPQQVSLATEGWDAGEGGDTGEARNVLWPLAEAYRTRQIQLVRDLARKIPGPLPLGIWQEPVDTAVVAPIPAAGENMPCGFLILGINPCRPWDELYQSFIQQAAEGVARALSVAEEHERAHTELRARLDKIASVAPVAIHELRLAADGSLSMPYSTAAIVDIFGITPEEIARDVRVALNSTHPDDYQRVRELFLKSKRDLKPARAEFRVTHKTKGELWVELHSVPEPQPDGGMIWYGYYHDITERKSMEEALRERESRFRELAENIQEFFWLLDVQKEEYLYVSPAYETIWGRTCASLREHPPDWLTAIHGEDQQRVREAWARYAEGDYDVEYRVVRPDGSVRYIHDRAFPIRNEQGVVYRVAGISEDITAQKDRERQIRFLAYHDALTKLPNRALLANRLRQAIAHVQHNERTVALLFLDLDRFKTINDTLGHGAGDALLQQVAERLIKALRAEDTVARAGGDEFLLLVSDLASAEDAVLAAERVLASLSAPFRLGDHSLRVTGSIGISVCPRDAMDVHSLIKYADTALYLAKEQGRNTFRFFSPELDARVRARMHLENDLRSAVDQNQFVLYYQPKIDLASRAIIGAEALIRWQHPVRGLIAPDEFIPVAEDTGLIVPIGEWALHAACLQAREWRAHGVRNVRVQINISSRQLHSAAFVSTVKGILEDTHCDPGAIGVEITESAAMTDPNQAIEIIQLLHDMGIETAIDDFGTGYSSLAYLKRFALDLLKIDSTFIQGLPDDRDDVAIVRAIIALAHQFRLKVVAEGVESQAQQAFLRAHRCDAVQGFLISKPVPASEVWQLSCRAPLQKRTPQSSKY